jgi:hypothetical protein
MVLYKISNFSTIKTYLKETNMLKRSWLSLLLLLNIFLFGLIGFAHQAFPQENIFTYDNFSFTLPEGWVKQDIPKGSEKETVGSLKSEKMEGTSILMFCYRGRQYSYSSTRITGLKTIAAVYPKGQEQLKKETKMKTDGGLAVITELWRGAVDASGKTVLLQTPMGIIKSRAGWILMLGFTPDSSGGQLEEDFIKMIKSAK